MKASRHALIYQLIEHNNVETQDELAQLLRDNGYPVTQATVSRDIKELRLIKVLSDNGFYKYATVDKAENNMQDRFNRIFSQSVLSMTGAGNLIIIKTLSGSANAAAEAVDSLRWPEIAGTLAGDNTIFIAVREAQEVTDMLQRFRAIIK